MSERAILFGEDHGIAADLQTDKLFTEIELLKKVNLVDEYYHYHKGEQHGHFHMHSY